MIGYASNLYSGGIYILIEFIFRLDGSFNPCFLFLLPVFFIVFPLCYLCFLWRQRRNHRSVKLSFSDFKLWTEYLVHLIYTLCYYIINLILILRRNRLSDVMFKILLILKKNDNYIQMTIISKYFYKYYISSIVWCKIDFWFYSVFRRYV